MRNIIGRWYIVAPVFLAIGLVIGITVGSSGSKPAAKPGTLAATHAAVASPVATVSGPASSAAPAAFPSPNATGSGSCDYTLAVNPDSDSHLTGEVDVTNTGNIGVIAEVSISWPQEGYAPIKQTKTVKVPYGASGQPVMFNYNAGSISGGSNVISNLQNWESGHPDAQSDCTYSINLTGTYGTAH